MSKDKEISQLKIKTKTLEAANEIFFERGGKRISRLEEELDALETSVRLLAPDWYDDIMAMKDELIEEFEDEDDLRL
jgi:hypothetical protein